MQRLLLDAARSKKTNASSLAQLARAWSELEERKRVLKMQPKPKDLDTTKLKKVPRESLAGPVEVPPEDWVERTRDERLKGQTPNEPPQGTPGNQSPGTSKGELAGDDQGISFG